MRVERLLRWLAPRKTNELRCQCAVVTGASTYKARLSHARHLVEPAKYAPSPSTNLLKKQEYKPFTTNNNMVFYICNKGGLSN